MKPLSIGILGGGINSAVGFAHISALRLTGMAFIDLACFSRDTEVNRESANFYHVDSRILCEDFDSFIQRASEAKIDLVVLLTPTDQHYTQLTILASLKIPVLSEKALTTSSQSAKEVTDRFSKEAIRNWVVFNYTSYPMVREACSIVKAWRVEDLISLRLQMPQQTFLRKDLQGNFPNPQSWRTRDYAVPTISLDLGVHLFSIAQIMLGFELSFSEIASRHSSSGQVPLVIDDVAIMTKLKSGVHLDFWFSKVALGHQNGLGFSVYSKHGSIHWTQNNPDFLKKTDKSGNNSILARGDFGLNVANLPRYSRFKGGHPTGFIEALSNYYIDVFADLNSAFDVTHNPDQNSRNFTFTFEDSILGLDFFQKVFEEDRSMH